MTERLTERAASVRRSMGRAVARTVDALFPPVCLVCRTATADADTVCGPCWTGIDFVRPPLCDRLGIPLPFDTRPPGTDTPMIAAAAAADPPVFARARAVALYGPSMQRLVHALKYHDRHDGRRLFGRWLTAAGAELIAEADVIVAIPLHPWRLLARRYNQSALLAHEVARCTGLPFAATALVRTRATPQQVGLSQAARQRNVAGAFKVPALHRHRVSGRRVLLVDDVITTGATCNAAARALLRAKAARVDVLALAVAAHTV